MLKRIFSLLCMGAAMAAAAVEIADRPGKATKDILIFSQWEMQYGTFQNFLHYWKDRPLYVDPAHRYEGNNFDYVTDPSMMKNIEIAKSYNIAGLSPLGGVNNMAKLMDLAEKHDVQGFQVMPAVYLPGIAYSSAANFKTFHAILERSMKSNKVFRINGKVVINSYESASAVITPERLKTMLDDARKAKGDGFLFIADMKIPGQRYYRHFDSSKGKPAPEETKKFVDTMQAYLDVADGLYLYTIGKKSSYVEGGEYGTHWDQPFFDHVKPLILELFARPQNKGKVMGAVCQLGYVNHFSGMINPQEYGSETFRKNFEALLSLNPDFIVTFEWNEWNENTCFVPSVYKGSGYRRMLRYYQSLFDGKKLEPLPGDDLSIPNMLLSYRYACKLGDVMRFEMLNIPDGGPSGKYKAQIVLKDIKGKVVHAFDEVTIDGGVMQAVTQTLPSEKFTVEQVLIPELTVTDAQGNKRLYADNLYIRLTPTENRIFQYVRMALREAATVKVTDFTATPEADGSYRVRGRVEADAPIASVELLDNRDEMRALGEDKPEFDQNEMVVIQMTTQAVPGPRLTGPVEMRNVSRCIARSAKQDGNNENFRFDITEFGIDYHGQGIGKGNRRVFFAIPRKEADKAVLRGSLNIGEFSIPVADIMKYGTVAREFEPCIFFRFDRFEAQPDIPVRLNKKAVEFDCKVFSEFEFPVFHLRVIMDDGKLFRSAPIQAKFASGKLVDLPVWSETDRKLTSVKVAADRIPDANYIFEPGPGAILRNSYAPRFDGEIGGGYRYSQPFAGNRVLIKGAKTAAAQWRKDTDGRDILHFDGIMQNVTFEPEVFPRGAFTLECEFRPETKEDMAIFRHTAGHPGSLGVFIKGGKLYLNFMKPTTAFRNMPTWLPVKAGEWNTLKITSNISTLTVTLNGESQTFNGIGLGGLFRSSCFGGPIQNYGAVKGAIMFKGDLRKLRICHNAEK